MTMIARLVAAVLAAALVGCGAAPGDFPEAVETAPTATAQAPEAGPGPEAATPAPAPPAAAEDAGTALPDAAPKAAPDEDAGPDVATPVCDATTCPTGCCDGTVCVDKVSQHECGNAGAACQDCGSGEAPYDLQCGALYTYSNGVATGITGGFCCETGKPGCS
jgi:hypothetical protein